MSRPIAVLTSDVHYNLQTLPLADSVMRQAINKANSLNVPLIVAGDLHDTKANLRGECVNQMIETFKLCDQKSYVIIGNHDLINESSKEHSLNFLEPYTEIVNTPYFYNELGAINGNSIWLLPYFTDPNECQKILSRIDLKSCIIMHQGLKDGHMGDYIRDHSAITKSDVAGLRIISGHYHTRQTIDLPNGGKWDYIGNPYTLTFGEANDPEKGFQILHNDGTLEFVPTNLRKHVIISCMAHNYKTKIVTAQADDLVWVKMSATVNDVVTRKDISEWLNRDSFKFTVDYIPSHLTIEVKTDQTQESLLDEMLDKLPNSAKLKALWRGLCE